MIQVYNIISGVHNSYSFLQFNMSNVSIIRGNQFKMHAINTHSLQFTKALFTNRVIDVWSSLPNEVVSADSTKNKSRLDTFWYNQDFKFDWKAEITGIGNRIA